MISIEDQIGNWHSFETYPKRIISLVPSLTELLLDLKLKESVIGRTKFCVSPKNLVKSIEKIGGTKTPDLEKIKSLSPDFILANKEENKQEDIEVLQKICPVYVSDITTLADNAKAIEDIGTICNCSSMARQLNKTIEKNFEIFTKLPCKTIEVAYFIWKDPYMVAGKNNFINSILEKIKLKNIYSDADSRYPTIQLEELKNREKVVILLSDEPFPFAKKHIKEFRKIITDQPIELVDATFFSWYGSRMVIAPKYLLPLRNRIENLVKQRNS